MPTTGCPHCSSTDIARKRRRGILDRLRATFNRWPYRCLACGQSFHGSGRRAAYGAPPKAKPAEKPRPQQATGNHDESSAGPRVAYKTEPMRPYAKIVLEADTHEQMDAILLALSRAVATHKGSTRDHAGSSRRANA